MKDRNARSSSISKIQMYRKRHVQLKQIYLTAIEPEALADFYKALGLAVRFADPGKWIQFTGEKTAFCIAGPTESTSLQGQGAVVVFEVDDIKVAVESARIAGAEVFGEERDMGAHGRIAQIRDPLGNTVQFFQAARK
jgi:predicted enzyme related to lactoylglutathione lyase